MIQHSRDADAADERQRGGCVTTHVDGAPPSVARDPDDGEPHDGAPSGSDVGSEWVRAEMLRRMAANRSTRGRHARGGEAAAAALAERDGPVAPADGARPGGRNRPEPPPPAQHLQPAQPPPARVAGHTSPADLPENYVPRHSVQTPGPAADPAAPISGPIPVVRPVAGPIVNGAPAEHGPGADRTVVRDPARGPIGGPSLPPTGLPVRRRRGSGPGTPLHAENTVSGPWSRPGPIVPNEPARRLGAPPEMLGGPEPIPSWGVPLASPPRGFARPVPPADAESVEPPDAAADGVSAGQPVAAGDDVEVTDPTGSAVGPAVPVEAAPVDEGAAPDTDVTTDGVATKGAGSPSGSTGPTGLHDTVAAGGAPSSAGPARTNGAAAPPFGPVTAGAPAPAGPVDAHAAASPGVAVPAETSTETTGEITDLPTAPHPIVLAPRAMAGRLVAVPAQRSREQARTVAPRPMTPRTIPVVGTAPPEPGSTRVRVVLSERKGVARPVRTIKEVQEGTAVGELLRRDLIRSQLRVTLRFALLTALVLGALPAVFSLLPEVSRFHLLGLRLPWVLLGVLMYPFLVGVAWRYTRVADRVEQNFADHVQD
jgi:hypothetical protein